MGAHDRMTKNVEVKKKVNWEFEEIEKIFESDNVKVVFGHSLKNGNACNDYLYFFRKDERTGEFKKVDKFNANDADELAKAFAAAAQWMEE